MSAGTSVKLPSPAGAGAPEKALQYCLRANRLDTGNLWYRGQLGRLLIAEFSERFGRVTGKLTIHSYGSARERLEFSVERVRELGLESEVRQEDLACLAGLSRVTVNRLLNADRPFAR